MKLFKVKLRRELEKVFSTADVRVELPVDEDGKDYVQNLFPGWAIVNVEDITDEKP